MHDTDSTGQKPLPSQIWISPTTRCNTRCNYCEHSTGDFGKDMDQETFARIEAELQDSVRKVNIFGYGEPLMSKVFPDIMRACIRWGVEVGVVSNGILLNEANIDLLNHSGVNLVISVDGPTEETYAHTRPLIPFRTITRALGRLREAREAKPHDSLVLSFGSVVLSGNIASMADLVRFAADHGVEHIHFGDLVPNRATNRALLDEMIAHHPQLIARYFPEVMDTAQRLGVTVNAPGHYFRIAGLVQEPTFTEPVKARSVQGPASPFMFPAKCHLPWTSCMFSVEGDVTSCCVSGAPLGNIRENSFREIWNGTRYKDLRGLIHTNNPPRDCKYCGLKEGINQGDTSFFRNYLERSPLTAVPTKAVRHVSGESRPTPRGGLILRGPSRLAFPGKVDGYLAMDITSMTDPKDYAVWRAILNGRGPYRFDNSERYILLPLPSMVQGANEIVLDLQPERPDGPELTVVNLGLRPAESLPRRSKRSLASTAQANAAFLENMRARMAALRSEAPERQRALIFGANSIGACLRGLAVRMGFTVTGYMDNFALTFGRERVMPPRALAGAEADCVIIASMRHAAAIQEQIQETCQTRGLQIVASQDPPSLEADGPGQT